MLSIVKEQSHALITVTNPKNRRSKPNKDGNMGQYYRTSITLPVTVAEEIEKRRGEESFSGQIAKDLEAYWEACRSGLHLLCSKFTRAEAEYLATVLDARNWGAYKIENMSHVELIESLTAASKGEAIFKRILPKLKALNMFELQALLNWNRTARQRNDSPQTAAAIFPESPSK